MAAETSCKMLMQGVDAATRSWAIFEFEYGYLYTKISACAKGNGDIISDPMGMPTLRCTRGMRVVSGEAGAC